jgi:hypothetical protein
MSQYATKTTTMQKVIENLELQLEIAQSEGRLSKAGKQRLRQLKTELKNLDGTSSRGFSGKTAVSSRSGGKLGGDETSSEGESRSSSRSHSMSLDGVNDAGHPAPYASAKKPIDKFYLDVVSRACGLLPSSAAQETAGPVRMAPSQSSTPVESTPRAAEETKTDAVIQSDQRDESTTQGNGGLPASETSSSRLGPLPSGQVYPTLATIYLALGTETERTPPATPLQEGTAKPSPAFGMPARRVDESPYRSRSAEFSYGDVYDSGVVVAPMVPEAREKEDGAALRDDGGANAAAKDAQLGASPLRTPPASGATSDVMFQRSMSAFVDYHDVYAFEGDESDEGEEVLHFDTVAVPLNLGYPADATPGSRSQSTRPNTEDAEAGDFVGGTIPDIYSNHSSIFNLLERGFSGLSVADTGAAEPALPGGNLRMSMDTNETSETVETLDDLTYSTKNTPLKPETTAGGNTAAVGAGRGGGAGGNPLRLKRKSV